VFSVNVYSYRLTTTCGKDANAEQTLETRMEKEIGGFKPTRENRDIKRERSPPLSFYISVFSGRPISFSILVWRVCSVFASLPQVVVSQ